MKADGAAQEIKGYVQEAVGDAKATVMKTTDSIADAADENL